MGVGGYIPPKDLYTFGQNWFGGLWQFFPRTKKLFRETSYLFFLLAAGEIFGSWGGIYPPNEKNVPMSGFDYMSQEQSGTAAKLQYFSVKKLSNRKYMEVPGVSLF
jgi:hypothetical protein